MLLAGVYMFKYISYFVYDSDDLDDGDDDENDGDGDDDVCYFLVFICSSIGFSVLHNFSFFRFSIRKWKWLVRARSIFHHYHVFCYVLNNCVIYCMIFFFIQTY